MEIKIHQSSNVKLFLERTWIYSIKVDWALINEKPVTNEAWTTTLATTKEPSTWIVQNNKNQKRKHIRQTNWETTSNGTKQNESTATSKVTSEDGSKVQWWIALDKTSYWIQQNMSIDYHHHQSLEHEWNTKSKWARNNLAKWTATQLIINHKPKNSPRSTCHPKELSLGVCAD